MEAKLKGLSPILRTKNLEETISFYMNVLGFKNQSNFPNFASLTKDNVEIMMIVPAEEPGECDAQNSDDAFFTSARLTGSIFIFTENVDELWDKVKDKATIKTVIADREYLMRDFSILDNNGYELVFGQDISNQKALLKQQLNS